MFTTERLDSAEIGLRGTDSCLDRGETWRMNPRSAPEVHEHDLVGVRVWRRAQKTG